MHKMITPLKKCFVQKICDLIDNSPGVWFLEPNFGSISMTHSHSVTQTDSFFTF